MVVAALQVIARAVMLQGGDWRTRARFRKNGALASSPSQARRMAAALVGVFVFAALPLRGTCAEPAPDTAAASAPDPLFDEPTDETDRPGFPDPFEPFNRASFGFNRRFDRWVIDPATRVYTAVVPGLVRRGVRNALANLLSPSIFVNDVLQLRPVDASVTLSRLVVNTTLGSFGLIDAAVMMGLDRHNADFGQTLALLGVPSGPFLMIPFVGPTTLRDGTGYLVDVLFQPATWLLPATLLFTPEGTLAMTGLREGSLGFTRHEVHHEELKALERSSVDYYAALRNAYFQDRTARIWARPPWWRRPVEVASD